MLPAMLLHLPIYVLCHPLTIYLSLCLYVRMHILLRIGVCYRRVTTTLSPLTSIEYRSVLLDLLFHCADTPAIPLSSIKISYISQQFSKARSPCSCSFVFDR